MKTLLLIPPLLLLQSFTHPFAQEGSVDTDREIVDERIEKAHQNQKQEQRAEETVEREKRINEEIDRNLQPDVLLQDKKEGSVE